MNFKLYFASLWLPHYVLKRELDELATATINGLDNLLKTPKRDRFNLKQLKSDKIEIRRAEMASIHNKKVKELIDIYGYSEAIKLGRKSMYKVGLSLGIKTRDRLNVGSKLDDLELAAKILYKILGIEFQLKKRDGILYLVVNRCALADHYNADTCKVLSAADEGVFHGISSGASMKFEERITENKPECLASIKMRGDV
ncbi:MAG: hypothetical protein QME14_01830 [Methanobacteriaceae archaeon]|nr:hypothetical protein [Methanobacteriaceae archaeon]